MWLSLMVTNRLRIRCIVQPPSSSWAEEGAKSLKLRRENFRFFSRRDSDNMNLTRQFRRFSKIVDIVNVFFYGVNVPDVLARHKESSV